MFEVSNAEVNNKLLNAFFENIYGLGSIDPYFSADKELELMREEFEHPTKWPDLCFD